MNPILLGMSMAAVFYLGMLLQQKKQNKESKKGFWLALALFICWWIIITSLGGF
jgi:hypothetical protein